MVVVAAVVVLHNFFVNLRVIGIAAINLKNENYHFKLVIFDSNLSIQSKIPVKRS